MRQSGIRDQGIVGAELCVGPKGAPPPAGSKEEG